MTLISFEGGEGSGKTTLIKKLAAYFESQGRHVLVTREPGGTALSENIREWLLNSTVAIAPTAELLLFLAARAQHIHEKIAPAMERGEIVLCDRFNDSTVVYQGIARGLGLERVKALCENICGAYQPTLTLYLDVDPEVGLKRATGTPDRMEREALDFHRLVRQGYQTLAKQDPERIRTLDSSRPPKAVFEQALEVINAYV